MLPQLLPVLQQQVQVGQATLQRLLELLLRHHRRRVCWLKSQSARLDTLSRSSWSVQALAVSQACCEDPLQARLSNPASLALQQCLLLSMPLAVELLDQQLPALPTLQLPPPLPPPPMPMPQGPCPALLTYRWPGEPCRT